MPRYRILQPTFIPPHRLEAGTIILWDGPVGPQFEPLDSAASEAMEAWYAEHPSMSLNPVSDLPVKRTELVIEALPPKVTELEAQNLASLGPGQPGLSNGGAAIDLTGQTETPEGLTGKKRKASVDPANLVV